VPQHREAVGRKHLQKLALGLCDALAAAHHLQVRPPYVRDDADVRPRDESQMPDLPEPAHGHLDHGVRHRRLGLGPNQGRSDLRVAVAGGLENRAGDAERRSQELFGGGLAVAARDPDDPPLEAVAERHADAGHRADDVRNQQAGNAQLALGQGKGGSGGERVCSEVVPVDALSPDAEEHVAGPHLPAVPSEARRDDVRSEGARHPSDDVPQLARRDRPHGRASKASRAIFRSSIGNFVRPMIW
jgi:hypothetical protein